MGRRAASVVPSAAQATGKGKGKGLMRTKKTVQPAPKRKPSRVEPRSAQGINPALMVPVGEARRMLGGMGQKAIYGLMACGEIVYLMVGRSRYIPVWSLEDFAGVPPDRRRSAVGAA